MDADLKKLKKVTAFMRKQGILNYKTPELELSLAPAALITEPLSQAEPSQTEDLKPEFSPEEMLFWSAPGLHPDLEQA